MKPVDTRAPSPPLGYSCFCDLPEMRQVELVAEFHAYRIRPSRIAYRLGIDIALIDELLAGERYHDQFAALVALHRRRRYQSRVDAANRRHGQHAYELRQQALEDFQQAPEV